MNLRCQVKQWLYQYCPGLAGAFPYFGTKIYFPQESSNFRQVCQQGIYEKDNILFLMSLVRPGSVYFDIGANIGLMAAPILHRWDSCKVVSFEAAPSTFRFLQQTAQASPFHDRWHVECKAIGNTIGTLDISADQEEKITVPVTTIDAEWEALGRPAVSAMKIDIEGAELAALQGAITCIKQEQPYILLEWSAAKLQQHNCPLGSLLPLANRIKYQIYSLPNLVPVTDLASLRVQMLKTESFLLISNTQIR